MNPHSEKVIIRGHIFDYAEKAPFVVSGKSVLGAIEYDSKIERLKCHECGEWFRSLGHHTVSIHRITARDFKIKHGLQQSTSLQCPMTAAKQKARAQCDGDLMRRIRREPGGPRPVGMPSARLEQRNLTSSCDAQLLFRIQLTAATLGRTPTQAEINAAGIVSKTLRERFGTLSHAIELAGLNQNLNRGRNFKGGQLPKGFPTKKQLDDSRMPWPKEYFGVNGLERRRA